MFSVKVCGITRVEDALMAAAAGADALGLNFYRRSPRFVQDDAAGRICEALAGRCLRVGLFVNAAALDVCRLFDRLPLDMVQLHGDEPPQFLKQLGGRPVMRALRVGPGGLQPVAAYLDQCRSLKCLPNLLLLDSAQSGQYGGTGQTSDWSVVGRYNDEIGSPPMVLAGGLTPDNVAAAVAATRPVAVDTASGVEQQPGRKDEHLVRRFVAAARKALSELQTHGGS